MLSPKVIVAHLGARKHYQEPILFYRWGVLERFYTDFYAGSNPIPVLGRHPAFYKYAPSFLKKALDRYDPLLDGAPITHYPTLAYRYTKALSKAAPHETSHLYNWVGKEFCQRIIARGLGNADTIYGFPVSSVELFEYAKSKGLRCILDQTIAERALTFQLLLEEEERWSDWSTAPFQLNAADQELIEREHREQDIADHIVCGSQFVKDSLVARGIKADQISVVALGRAKERVSSHCPTARQSAQKRGESLRILFAGTVNLRKGIPYLLEALKQLKGAIPFTCKVAGSIEIKFERVAEYSDVCEFLGRVPRSEMTQLYDWADVFVLPSIAEGSAMVTYEALLAQIPIITTYNAGSLVQEGVGGSIVPIRNADVITEQLINVYHASHEMTFIKPSDLANIFQEHENKLRLLVYQQPKLHSCSS